MPRVPLSDEISSDIIDDVPWEESGELDFEKTQVRDWFWEQDYEYEDVLNPLYEDNEYDEE